MGSLGRRRILRARGSTSALIEAAAAAGGEGEDRFASAFGRLDAARRRHKRAARLDAGRAAWIQQHAALAQAARRFDDDGKAMVSRGSEFVSHAFHPHWHQRNNSSCANTINVP